MSLFVSNLSFHVYSPSLRVSENMPHVLTEISSVVVTRCFYNIIGENLEKKAQFHFFEMVRF